jgi:uncharacterized membrane protein YcgQ (UPF0703/DUF1980 family)
MKKRTILPAVCLLCALSGCQLAAPVKSDVKNGAGTAAVNLPAESAPKSPAASENAGFAPEVSKDGAIEIKEKMFVAQTNEIYQNAADYLGKTIRLTGLFKTFEGENGAKYYTVVRYGPGCCGTDSNPGFEALWDKGYPDEDAWVEATGVLEAYTEDGEEYLRLALSSLTPAAAGAERVSQ